MPLLLLLRLWLSALSLVRIHCNHRVRADTALKQQNRNDCHYQPINKYVQFSKCMYMRMWEFVLKQPHAPQWSYRRPTATSFFFQFVCCSAFCMFLLGISIRLPYGFIYIFCFISLSRSLLLFGFHFSTKWKCARSRFNAARVGSAAILNRLKLHNCLVNFLIKCAFYLERSVHECVDCVEMLQ